MDFLQLVALGDLDGMRRMLDADPVVAVSREGSRRGDAPLHAAARSSQVEATRLLLEHGAEVGALNGHSRTPLAVAVDEGPVAGCAELASTLLAHGADANDACGHDGVSKCLHRAIIRRDAELVNVLLEGGADVEARGAGDRTPLYLAVGTSFEMARAVLGFDPDLTVCCSRDAGGEGGETALELARRLGKAAMIALLEGRSP